MIVNHINFYSAMHGFRDNEVVLPRKDMTASSVPRQGAFHAMFHDGFWKSDHDFLIVIHGDCISAIHGFRDNEALLQAEYDVIMSSPSGGASHYFIWRILNEGP